MQKILSPFRAYVCFGESGLEFDDKMEITMVQSSCKRTLSPKRTLSLSLLDL